MSDFLTRISHFSPKRLALLADELNDRVQSLEDSRHEPIAIVGIGCRFPGGVDTPAKYWTLLHEGVDAITEVPRDRWDIDALFDPDPDAPGKMSTRWGGFVGPVDGFDAHFFGISPREAHSMDPQQRLLMEVTWRALEDAGISPQRLDGTRTGVYVGMSAGDYYLLMRSGGVETFDAYTASGTAHSIASGRLSYFLGLRGPSVSIDTACSSSLVAIHNAVHSLRRGECDLALAGGVNLILGPDVTIALSKSRMMAPDGRCKAFDARADGFVRGEGCGMLVLKRLSQARADGDRIVALIRGSAANQDGRSNGLTAPNGQAQEAVLRDALADARCGPEAIDFVEAHGTGTSLGDPIEVNALNAVLGAGRAAGRPLRVGSVKASIGHLEASAGVAGVIKTALALSHGEIPGQLHVGQLNPHIAWLEMPIEVPRASMPWSAADGSTRLAGVSSFGFSGTNVHLVMEEAPQPVAAAESEAPALAERAVHLLPVSARGEEALRAQLAALAGVVAQAAPGDLAHSLGAGRAHFSHRAAVLASTPDEAAARLAVAARGEPQAGVHCGVAGARAPRIAFLFTGQGSQYAGMAQGLYRSEPVFREALDRCDELLRPHLPQPLLAVLFPEAGAASPIDDTAYTQPALFGVEYALAQLWLSWGVKPSMVTGHSVGEYVAACIAGVFSLEDALRLIAARGRLMGALPREGAMAAVMATEERVSAIIGAWPRELGIAAVNGPQSIVVSGHQSAMDAAIARFAAEGIKATRLNVSHAFHSPMMQPMLAEFARVAASVSYSAPQVDLVSNVTGAVAGARVANAEYWSEHILAPVQFAKAVRTMAAAGCQVFLEIGPHPVLLGMAGESVPAEAPASVPSLRRNRDDNAQMMEGLAALYVRGVEVDWQGLDRGRRRRRLPMPGYPFQRERYWAAHAAVSTSAAPAASVERELHPLLGREVAQSLTDDRLFEGRIGLERFPWLADHRIHGALLLPSPALMEMALAAGEQVFEGRAFGVADFTVHQPLLVEEGAPAPVQLVVGVPAADGASWRIAARDAGEGAWRQLASGRMAPLAEAPGRAELDALRARVTEPVDIAQYYGWLDSLGLEFGPRFRGANEAWRRDGEVLARMQLPAALESGDAGFGVHPALLDACLHLIGAALPGLGLGLKEAFLLLGVDRIERAAAPGRAFWIHIEVRAGDQADLGTRESFRADLRIVDEAGSVAMRLAGMQLKRARPGALLPQRLSENVRRMLHEVAWREAPGAGGGLAGTQAVATHVLPRVSELAARNGLDAYARFVPQLDALAAAHIVRALRELGVTLAAGERYEPEALRKRLGVAERHRRLFERMLAILGEDGVLQRDGSAWKVARTPAEVDLDARYREVLAAHPDCKAELSLTRRCAGSLAPVLRGAADPLPLLFPEGSLAETEALYQNSPPAKTYNGVIADSLDAMLASWPAGRKLRVLEIGAGTGSTAAYLMPRLRKLPAGSVDYCFTDVSPLFLKRAREKFPDAPFLRTQILDIGADLRAQGFAPGSFDVIVGSNVLHATPDLEVTLGNVRGLLAPGGRLVLLEGATPQRFGDLTVGLLEGWWCYTDTKRRNYALMPRAAWLTLFGEVGFANAVAIPGEDSGPVLRQQAVYLAEAPAAAPRAKDEAGWILARDAGGVAEALAQLLRVRGDRVELVAAGDVEALRRAAARPCAGLVHLGALDVRLDDTKSVETLMHEQRTLVGGALAIVQQLAARAEGAPPALWFVTRGGQAVAAGESADPTHATLWGFAHVVAIEHPELACRRVDVDPAANAAAAARALADELVGASAEDQVALRGGRRLVRRLVHRVPRPAAATAAGVRIDANRSYLVTGGMRGLGLLVAQWLVDRGARNVALMGRNGPDARARDAIAGLESRGVRVLVLQGDVARAKDVEAAFARIAAEAPPLAGIVHSAGVLDDGVIASQDWSRFATVMGPKLQGTWHLHRLAQGLDFLVLFSSGASLAGSAGQSNHAAANAFEDALAWYRQARGLPTVSINWGPWAEVGAAVDRAVSSTGLAPIAPADGLAAMEYAMRSETAGAPFALAQLAVLRTDWSHLAQAADAGRLAPLFSELLAEARRDAPAVAGPAGAAPATQGLRERIRAAMPNRRRAVLRDHVRDQTVKVLGLARPEDVDINEPLRQLGLDSLMAVELRNLLGKAVERSLPATLTFDHPTVAALVDHLATVAFAEELGAAEAQPAQAPPAVADKPEAAEAFDDMSHDELAMQLASRLDRLSTQEKT